MCIPILVIPPEVRLNPPLPTSTDIANALQSKNAHLETPGPQCQLFPLLTNVVNFEGFLS